MRWGTRAEQRTIRTTLATIADAGVAPPSAIVVGPVAGLDLAWFEARPLFGAASWSPAPASRRARCATRLEELGAEVIELPTIAIEPLAVRRCPTSPTYTWLVFTSANGVDGVLRPRARAGGPRRPRARPASGSPRSARAPPPRSRASASAPTSCPSASSPSRCSRRSRPRSSRRARCSSPGPSRRATSCPRVSSGSATRSTCSPCTGPSPPTPDPDDLARVRAGDGRRDHVHVVVDGHRTSATRRAAARPAPASCRSARSRPRPPHAAGPRGRPPRPIRTRSTASSRRCSPPSSPPVVEPRPRPRISIR